ncbi:MAG TPA: hypothetical protein VFB58_00535 [Chloroflexota bacterium]|nr:hypothetical protein [Chloroflexota bacterium]
MLQTATTFNLAASPFVPFALGFFGLGVGYFVWGGQLLFGFPAATPNTDRSLGMWGIWMPGFMQFIAGITTLIGLTWFHVFAVGVATTPAYMAALAFTAYGVHWFVLGWRRYVQSDVMPDAWMAIPFFLISVLGIIVFFDAKVNDKGVGILFIFLALIYLSEALARFGLLPGGRPPMQSQDAVPERGLPTRIDTTNPLIGIRLVGLWQFLGGIWLMYLTYALTLDLAIGAGWPV